MNLQRITLLFLFLGIAQLAFASDHNIVDKKSGVLIDFDTNNVETNRSWKKESVKFRNSRLKDESKIELATQTLLKALHKYPDGFLRKYIKKIYVWNSFSFRDVEIGGMPDTDLGIIYMNYSDSSSVEKAQRYMEICFHHELLHILHEKNNKLFHEKAWNKMNEPGFKYYGGGNKAIRNNKMSCEFATIYNQQGFLYEYAQSAIEEDFASFAEVFLEDTRGFWQIINSSPKVAEKLYTVLNFYNMLDPAFTVEFFKSVHKENYFG